VVNLNITFNSPQGALQRSPGFKISGVKRIEMRKYEYFTETQGMRVKQGPFPASAVILVECICDFLACGLVDCDAGRNTWKKN
jgi:hypothetical protein